MKKLLLMIPLTIVLVLSLTLTSFAASSSPSSGESPVYAPSQAPLEFSFAVGDYPKTDGLQGPTKYNLFMDVGSPVVSSGTTYSNIKLWNNSLGIEYSFRTAVSVGNGVNGLTITKGNATDHLNKLYPEFSSTGSNFVYDPSLVQGTYRTGTLAFNTSLIRPYADLIQQTVIYSGSLLYPTTGGSVIPVPFRFENTLYTGAVDDVKLYRYTNVNGATVGFEIMDCPVATLYGCSLVPSKLTPTGNADKLTTEQVFNISYQLARSLGIDDLIDPSFLARLDVPLVFSTYSVSYSLNGSSVAQVDPEIGGEDTIDSSLWHGGEITLPSFNILLPSTLNGSPRLNESVLDFVEKAFPEQDFTFLSFITTIIGGVLSVELFPGFALYSCLSVVVAISLISWLLKVFAGG